MKQHITIESPRDIEISYKQSDIFHFTTSLSTPAVTIRRFEANEGDWVDISISNSWDKPVRILTEGVVLQKANGLEVQPNDSISIVFNVPGYNALVSVVPLGLFSSRTEYTHINPIRVGCEIQPVHVWINGISSSYEVPTNTETLMFSNTGEEVTIKVLANHDTKRVGVINCYTGEFIHLKEEEVFCSKLGRSSKITFIMPDDPVKIVSVPAHGSVEQIKEEEKSMEPKNSSNEVVTTFEIPEDIAKRLSELLVTQSIREKLLDQNIDNPAKYEAMEKKLIPIVSEIEALKATITNEYVPKEYQSEEFVWNYDGYEISGKMVSIMNA